MYGIWIVTLRGSTTSSLLSDLFHFVVSTNTVYWCGSSIELNQLRKEYYIRSNKNVNIS
jgi:hypothetical protein